MSFPPKATFLPCWLKHSVMMMACLIQNWMFCCRPCHLQTCREALSLCLSLSLFLRCISVVFLQMTNPAIQNDFSYYRRTLSRMRINNVPVSTLCPSPLWVVRCLFVFCFFFIYIHNESHDYLYVKWVACSDEPTKRQIYEQTVFPLCSTEHFNIFLAHCFGFTACKLTVLIHCQPRSSRSKIPLSATCYHH